MTLSLTHRRTFLYSIATRQEDSNTGLGTPDLRCSTAIHFNIDTRRCGISTTDVYFNSIVHVIDACLLPLHSSSDSSAAGMRTLFRHGLRNGPGAQRSSVRPSKEPR